MQRGQMSCPNHFALNIVMQSHSCANQFLDACPKEVIQKFINHSWKFVDSYRKGLTGEAAVWVVKKQKGHQAVSKKAMKALEEQSKLQKHGQIRGAWSL